MRGRKPIAIVTLILFLVSLAAPVAAAPFKDVATNHWAYRDVSKMYAKGVVAGYGEEYRPNESISREQTVVMLIRVMGLAGEAEGHSLPATFRNPEAISKDFRSIIALAVNKGVVAGGDLLDFRPRDPAKRYEIAVFIARAMGFDATASGSSVLPFTDAKELVDNAAWAVPYVSYVYHQGIMSGDASGAFRPMDHVTRAEMAALLSRVDAKLNKLAANTLKGEAYSISPLANSLLVQDGTGQIITVPIAGEASIFKNKKPVSLSELQKGDKLEVIRNSLGQGVYVEVIPDEEFRYDELELSGTIETLTRSGTVSISVRTVSGLSTYVLDQNVKVTVDGLPAGLDDILAGQEVKILVRGSSVVQLEARNVEREVAGELQSVNLGLYPQVTILDNRNNIATYVVRNDARVYLDSSLAEIDELVPGQKVTAWVVGQEITRIRAESFSDEVTGTLVRAEFAPTERVIVKVETAKGQWSEKTFEVDKEARIRRDGRSATLRDLVAGDEVELVLENNKVVSLYAERVELETEGRIVAITLSYNPSLTLIDSKGQERTFTVASDARLRKGRVRIELNELRIDDYVSVRVEGQTIVDLRAEDRIVNDYLIGTIGEINEDAYVLVLEDLEENTRFGLGVYVDEYDTRIIKFGRDIDFEDLSVGDRIVVVGKAESYRFLAESILVISASR